jgi:AraC family transcriptional regulator of adaptative response/methylated-DNA-[protein]-cysteine methyltransferase
MTIATMIDADRAWSAVLARDTGADGTFVTAVRTTGIYCRPSCPARHPKRENVQFFGSSEEAERSGYRACKRCKPNEVHQHTLLVQQVCDEIDARVDDPPTLAELGKVTGMSPYHLQRVFKRVMGISPRQYADAKRLERLKSGLREEHSDVTTAGYEAGYGSSSRLYEHAPEQLGMTPGTYRRGGRGMHVRYSIVDSPLGRLLVGTTERGVCKLSIGDDDDALRATLRQEYPEAEFSEDDDICPWVAAILSHLEGRQPSIDLPLDVQATAFQRRVWQELRTIPYGQTRSYAEVATAIGEPMAVRAVANACGKNPVAIVVPCHRVVRNDGSLGGYHWGVERKAQLLAQEAALAGAHGE